MPSNYKDFLPEYHMKATKWEVLDVKTLIYIPHLFFIFLAVVLYSYFMTNEVFPGPVLNLRIDLLVGTAGFSRYFCDSFFNSFLSM